MLRGHGADLVQHHMRKYIADIVEIGRNKDNMRRSFRERYDAQVVWEDNLHLVLTRSFHTIDFTVLRCLLRLCDGSWHYVRIPVHIW